VNLHLGSGIRGDGKAAHTRVHHDDVYRTA
jgi:hypothetical protein